MMISSEFTLEEELQTESNFNLTLDNLFSDQGNLKIQTCNQNDKNQLQSENCNTIRHDWKKHELIELFNLPFNDLLFKSHSIFRTNFDTNKIELASLCSIKTGSCPEDCKYCPQSAHYNTGLETKPFMSEEEILQNAKQAKKSGSHRFCMGAAWRKLHDRDIEKLCNIIPKIKNLGLETCLTLGMLTKKQSKQLKESGLDFYNHNIDSSEEFYKTIITTRKYSDRLETLTNVAEAGINVCSGGIVGMGETMEDRAEMLKTLANLPQHPQSVPINKLIAVKGTPLADVKEIHILDFTRVVAVARIIMPRSVVRISAGRESMSDTDQALCFFAGANSIFLGETLLTRENPVPEEDKALFEKLKIDPFS